MKTVYVGMCADVIHPGHMNIIKEAKKYGSVIIGLLTDDAIATYKRVPLMSYNERKEVISQINGVDRVVKQSTLDYIPNLQKYKPDFVVHGTDWRKGVQKKVRARVLKELKTWGGKLIEPEYTEGINSTRLIESLLKQGTTPEIRMSKLKRLIELKPIVKILEVHNGLTGLIVENAKSGNNQFDGMWLSSLTDSTAKGKPDTGCVDVSSRVNTINEVFEVTTKPMIVDGDNGGLTEHFVFMVKTLERLGVSAVIIEDKKGAKRNSLYGTDVEQTQETIYDFCEKISSGKAAQVTKDFMIIARIESLILGKGNADAIKRASKYVMAGADGIMIHSKSPSCAEILHFCKEFRKRFPHIPLIVVPTTYNHITETDLANAGINVVIYANHLLRAAYPAMTEVATKILEHGQSKCVDDLCMPIKDILELVPK